MPEIGPVDETTFCMLDCKFRADPGSITESEIGLLLERGRLENWKEFIDEQTDFEESFANGYVEGYSDFECQNNMENK